MNPTAERLERTRLIIGQREHLELGRFDELDLDRELTIEKQRELRRVPDDDERGRVVEAQVEIDGLFVRDRTGQSGDLETRLRSKVVEAGVQVERRERRRGDDLHETNDWEIGVGEKTRRIIDGPICF